MQQQLHFPRGLLPSGNDLKHKHEQSDTCCALSFPAVAQANPHPAVEHHTVSVAQALNVRRQVKADGSVADGVHCLSIKEVVRSRCRQKDTMSEESAETSEHNRSEEQQRATTKILNS